MASPVCPILLKQVVTWVEWTFAQSPDEKKRTRPQRAHKPKDSEVLSDLIKEVRRLYWQKKQDREPCSFTSCKEDTLQKGFWDNATRNFYSSVISTYISWNRNGIPREAQEKLPSLVAFADHLNSAK